VRILLDENFPLALIRRLDAASHEAEHIILLGQRGIGDVAIRRRLESEQLLFLTQDEEFLSGHLRLRATVMVSRVRQGRPIAERVECWSRAIESFLARRLEEKLFEILDSGELVPWRERRLE